MLGLHWISHLVLGIGCWTKEFSGWFHAQLPSTLQGTAGLIIPPLLFGTASGPQGSLRKDYRWETLVGI